METSEGAEVTGQNLRVGFIGLGVVGRTFAAALGAHGVEVAYFDVRGADEAVHIPYRPLPDLIDGADLLVSSVWTQAALSVAHEAARYLKPGQAYLDINSTSPALKIEMAHAINSSGADFVEGAILGPVAASGARAEILLGGPAAKAWVDRLRVAGLPNVDYLSPRYGEAATAKMLRSVFSKGSECLIIEMLAAARRAGIEEYMWNHVTRFMRENPFDRAAENWIRTHPGACERRQHEMEEVLETLETLEIEATMTRATAAFFARSAQLAPADTIGAKPDHISDVVEFFAKALSNRES